MQDRKINSGRITYNDYSAKLPTKKEIEERINQIKQIQIQKAMDISSKMKSHVSPKLIRSGIHNRKSNGNV
jgi:hypothetical protein